ncbi:biotin--[acetyl-CoA-carboxylase] ligase [Flavobacterium faecale]|uniref:Biotin--[acetyl-CoA-carboxylase] ligase n=1 Tax=Flavobacterium faecale TaxID=1355330 RepID=A0A2S1LHX3_9FLAO|nr:biotin--[acetyl-CoA-carboxylase] ligase [Flavobacterium faecale]AWG23353.1 biotin--[acetyl-CoA-carboxylase] ligase [Flavobacterium faecale]
MKLIKLNAIDSTNDYLKQLAVKEDLQSFTVVTAESQTKGRGQMGAVWVTEEGKNLIMSVFIKNSVKDITAVFDLNIAVAVSIIEALQQFEIPGLRIKWPNDIMSYNFKVGGILIENNIKADGSINSVIGLGLNVNQLDFGPLPKASSLQVITKKLYDRDAILNSILFEMQKNCALSKNNPQLLWDSYLSLLFKKGIPMAFRKEITGHDFMGIIQSVNKEGELEVLLEDDTIEKYRVKEVQMLY